MKTKKVLFNILLTLSVISCNENTESVNKQDQERQSEVSLSTYSFIDIILMDNRVQSYYLAIPVFFQNDTSYLVMQNSELSSLLEKELKWDRMEYKRKIKELIRISNPLSISHKLWEEQLPNMINISEARSLSKIDLTKMKNEYFKNDIQTKNISENEKKQFLYLMYTNNYLVHPDDETGYLIIGK